MGILSWIFIALSATAAYRLSGTSLFWPSTINAVVNAWSLWSMNKTAEIHGINYTDNFGRVVNGISMLTTVCGVGLLAWSFFR